MDPFSVALGAGNIATGCGQAAVTIVKFCGDIRTVDTRIREFYDEIIALRLTYEGLAKSLETPILLEAARVASKTPDGAQLWGQVQIALDDSLYTISQINKVLDQISRKGSFARKVKTVFGDDLKRGELYHLRQRVQFINVTISLPIQMTGLMLQLEQRGIPTDHKQSLEARFTSLERDMWHLLKHPDIVSKYSSASLTMEAADRSLGVRRGETYLSFATKMLSTASAAAGTKSCANATSQQLLLGELSGSEPGLPYPPTQHGTAIPDWIPHPDIASDPLGETKPASSSTVAPINVQRIPPKTAEREYRMTQQHLKLGQEKAEKNEHESAEKSFKKALQLLVKHDFSGRISLQPAEVVLLLSKSCLEQKKYDEAIELLSPIAEQQPDFIPPSILSASADASSQVASLPALQSPDTWQALAARHMLGEAYKLKGDYESARDHALRAFEERWEELGEHDEKTRDSVTLLIEIFNLMGDDVEAEGYQVFLAVPTPPHDQDDLVCNDVQLSEEPVFIDRTEPKPPSIAPTPLYATTSSISGQRKPNRPSFTSLFRNIARPSRTSVDHPNSDIDPYGSPVSRFITRDSVTPDAPNEPQRRSHHFKAPSDTSHDRSNSFVDGESSSPSIGRRDRSPSIKALEPEFLAVEQLSISGNFDQATKIALKFLEGYGGGNFIIRKDEMEKNIRKGNGKGKGLASTGMGYSPLHYMCELKHEHTDEVYLMIKYGADVNATAGKASYGAKSNEVLTPLQLAIDRGHTGIAQLLLETDGIRTDINPGGNWYPILVAGRKKQYGTVKALLKHGPSSIPKTYPLNYYGCSPLHDAAKHCDLSLVEIILDHVHIDPDRLHVNVVDRFGKTPLMHAIIKNDVSTPDMKARMARQRREVIEALLNSGADVQILDHEGHSARWYAERESPHDQQWLCDLIGEARYEMMG